MNKPMGGTELMYNELINRLPSNYLDNYSIFNYPVYADNTKRLVYWNQLSYDQDIVKFLEDKENIDKIDNFVFVSHWQSEQFRKKFRIPGYKTTVIKNASIGVKQRTRNKEAITKICYTSTPWRGLDVLLKSWEMINTDNCELHIFSSTKIYGDDFASNNDSLYNDLYEKCKSMENVIYRGTIPNSQLRDELSNFDILAYPSTFEETSCIAVIEALSAGLRVITSNIGALPETTEGWSRMYEYLENKDLHAIKFAYILEQEIEKMRTGELEYSLNIQKQIYKPKWDWDQRIQEWINYLNILNLKI